MAGSIRGFYPLALAEGEGVGTAYEYFAKRLVLTPFLARAGCLDRVLIAGLPEKYGASLDFLLLAAGSGARVLVMDDRPEALAAARRALAKAQDAGLLRGIDPDYRVGDLAEPALDERFDLALSCEVLQRLSESQRQSYWGRLRDGARAVALFAPNGDNPAHTALSGLNGLTLAQVAALVADAPGARCGYIDMPPFPPGITRSEEQRARASSGRFEALAMTGLALYARAERLFPTSMRRRNSHIVFATTLVAPPGS